MRGAAGRELRVEDWIPIAWMPEDTKLLVRNQGSLAVLSVQSLDVEHVGPTPDDTIWSGVWAS